MTFDQQLKCVKEEFCKGPNPAISCHQSDNITYQECIFNAFFTQRVCNQASVAHELQTYSCTQKISTLAQELTNLQLLSLLTIMLILGYPFQPLCMGNIDFINPFNIEFLFFGIFVQQFFKNLFGLGMCDHVTPLHNIYVCKMFQNPHFLSKYA